MTEADSAEQPHEPYVTAERPASMRYRPPSRILASPDTIIIGSGIGGLALASLLAQKRGERVLVLEANGLPGGCTHCHEVDGFEFNSGVDSVGDMDPTVGRGLARPMIDFVTGGKLQWARMPDVHEVCAFGDEEFSWHSSSEANIDWVEREFPGQGDVRAYYALEERCEWWSWSWGLTKLFPQWVPEGMRDMLYRSAGGAWRRYMQRSVDQVMRSELGFSPKLAAVFSYMYGNYGKIPALAPFTLHALVSYHYRHGAFYPVGGPAQIAATIIPIVEAAGGQVAVSSRVERILVEGNRAVGVRLANGEEVRAKNIVSDASAWLTFTQLLDPEVSQRHGYARRFDSLAPSPAHLSLELGYDEHIELPKHIIWHMPHGPGVPPYDLAAADRLYKIDQVMGAMPAYVICPSARDPVYRQRHGDRSTVEVLAEAGPDWVERYRSDVTFRAELTQRAKARLLEIAHQRVPALRGKTPRVERFRAPIGCNPMAWRGCSYGLEISGDRFLSHTHWLRAKTTIDGLYLTGQDSFLPGFAGALMSSQFCYAQMFGDLLAPLEKPKVVRPPPRLATPA